MYREQQSGRAAEPAAAIESDRQRDRGKPQSLEHETLLGAIRNEDPVENDVEYGHDREDRDPAVSLRRSSGF